MVAHFMFAVQRGNDRTGFAVAFIREALGVDDKTVFID